MALGTFSAAGQSSAPAGAPSASQPSSSGEIKATLLHINDSHGQLAGPPGAMRTGGIARLATVVQQARQAPQSGTVFLVHCGDETSRGDALTMRSGGVANMTLMNYLKFDMMTPGNGEFYLPLPALQSWMKSARFPFLAANVTTADDKPLAESYIIRQAGPVRIAFFGLCFARDEELKADDLKLADALATARALVPRLRKQADVVVAVTHLGLLDDIVLANSVEGIDVILGGHTHTSLEHGYRAKGPGGAGVLICQAGDQYRYCGQVTLTFAPAEGGGYRISSATPRLIPLDEKVKPDPVVAAMLARLSGEGAARPASTRQTPPRRTGATAQPATTR
jgi:2',3'-cyclic-nucleotide 2'-phosphodiesterase (5'-nucleotidase family)